jgi:hypothetical protein
MKNRDFQREGAVSNAHVGREFEGFAQKFFSKEGVTLSMNLLLPVGINGQVKSHAFDLGCEKAKIIVECKSHTWTKGGNVPSAKMTCWNEAMYYFCAAPIEYRKIFFVLKDLSKKRGVTLAEYYLRTYAHLIPAGVELWEYDQEIMKATHING